MQNTFLLHLFQWSQECNKAPAAVLSGHTCASATAVLYDVPIARQSHQHPRCNLMFDIWCSKWKPAAPSRYPPTGLLVSKVQHTLLPCPIAVVPQCSIHFFRAQMQLFSSRCSFWKVILVRLQLLTCMMSQLKHSPQHSSCLAPFNLFCAVVCCAVLCCAALSHLVSSCVVSLCLVSSCQETTHHLAPIQALKHVLTRFVCCWYWLPFHRCL